MVHRPRHLVAQDTWDNERSGVCQWLATCHSRQCSFRQELFSFTQSLLRSHAWRSHRTCCRSVAAPQRRWIRMRRAILGKTLPIGCPFLSETTLRGFTHAPDRLHVTAAVRKPLASLPRRVRCENDYFDSHRVLSACDPEQLRNLEGNFLMRQ